MLLKRHAATKQEASATKHSSRTLCEEDTMHSHVVLLKESIFKSRYGNWYLIHAQNPGQRILVEDPGTIQLLRHLFSGVTIQEVASQTGLEEVDLRRFLGSLEQEGVIRFSEISIDSSEQCYDIDPPLDSLNILITNACNLHCAHCYVESGKKMRGELTGAEWIEVLKQACKLGVFGLNVSGGEPLMHKDFYDIADYIATVPTFYANLNTNGTQIRNGMEKIIARAFQSVQISIDSPIAREHDTFRGSEGCFQKTLASIQKLIEAGTEVNVGFTLTKDNLVTLHETIDMCESIGVTTINIGLVSDAGRAHRNQLMSMTSESVIVRDSFWEKMYRELRKLTTRSTTLRILLPFRIGNDLEKISLKKEHICDGDNNQILYIMADGTMMPCDKLPMRTFGYGNVRVNSLLDTWMSKQMRTFKLKSPYDLPKCRHCRYIKDCGGACVARAFHAGGSLESRDWISCIIAQQFAREQS